MTNETPHMTLTSDRNVTREIPDLVVLVVTLVVLQLLEVVQRHVIGPRFKAYNALTFRDRFDWDRRSINITFQVVQAVFNAYILLLDLGATSDILYGYSIKAHIGFLIIIAFYLYDTTGIIMHPLPPSAGGVWIIHHIIAVGLLVYNVTYKKSSAFPAATFLISAAGHIPNELRWFLVVSNQRNQAALNFANLLCLLIIIVTCVLPPPYLLSKAAQQLDTSVYDVVFNRMRAYCRFFFLLIYIPHVYLVYYQFNRLIIHWNKCPEPFRQRKVD